VKPTCEAYTSGSFNATDGVTAEENIFFLVYSEQFSFPEAPPVFASCLLRVIGQTIHLPVRVMHTMHK
jgi:hypothetical protein